MESYNYPDSHLSEAGRKSKYQLIEKLKKVATLISRDKNYYLDNPNRDVRVALQSIAYHTDQINAYPDTLVSRVQKFIESEVEDYHRKVKNSMAIRQQAIQKLEIASSHKSKALCGYEQEFKALVDKYEYSYGYGSCPVKIVETEQSKHPVPDVKIVDPMEYLRQSGIISPKVIPLTPVPQTPAMTPTLAIPAVVSTPVVVEQTADVEQVKVVEPVKEEKPAVEVVVKKTPIASFWEQEELELQRMRDEARRVERERKEKEQEQKERDLMLAQQRRRAQEEADIIRQRQKREEELSYVPPPAKKKGVLRGSLAKGPSIHLYSLPEE